MKTRIGERVNIFKGTALGFTEAPHLYKRDGWYYLSANDDTILRWSEVSRFCYRGGL